MGVTGLLPFLKKCTRQVNIKDFRGYTVAIDAYCWIHRASYSCAMDLALGNPTSQPILVFDGANLPAKAETESKRHISKKMYREKAAQHLLEGNRKAAQECFERCVEVTQKMAQDVIKATRDLGVDCIVAPYESDAQLAYLVQAGYADLVITEDSDLLLFGCKQVLFKLDMSGFGCLITWSAGIGEQCCGIPSQDFTPAHLRFIGILSGCDYFPGIPRIGLATAAKIMRQCRTTDFRYLLSNIGSFCNLADAACQPIGSLQVELLSQCSNYFGDQISLSPSSSVSTSSCTVGSLIRKNSSASRKSGGNRNKLHEDTIRAAMRAERTFRLQVVFDPKSRKRLRLSEPTMEDIKEERLIRADTDQPDDDLFFYAGDDSLESELALAIALGNVNFDTGEIIDFFNPDDFKVRKLFTGLRVHSENSLEMFSGSTNSVIRRVRRPDGDRLNISCWSASYMLEPVWLYYTDNGLQSRPFCISIDDGESNYSQHLMALPSKDQGKSIPLAPPPSSLPKPQPRLPDSLGLGRRHRIMVPSVLTAEPAITSAIVKRPLIDDSDGDTNYIKDVVASYISEEKPLLPKTPMRDFSSSETPITSAGTYFSSPVSAIIPLIDRPKSPVLHCKRSRSLVTEVNSAVVMPHKKANVFTQGIYRAPLTEHKQISLDQMKKPNVKPHDGASPLSQRFSFVPLKGSKEDTSIRKPHHQVCGDCAENERPTSPIFDEMDLESEPIGGTSQQVAI
ncbi:hypothetical protein Aperf_G00000095849 [Anoplocephala perfoliata]